MAYLRSQTRRMILVENSFLKLVNRQQQRPLILDLDSLKLISVVRNMLKKSFNATAEKT